MNALTGLTRATYTRREWQELSVGPTGLAEVQADRLDALAASAARRLKLPATAVLVRTHKALKAQQVVGILSVPGATLEILPKIDGEDGAARSVLIRMLAVAHDLRVTENELATLETQRYDLLEILIRLFSERLLNAVRQGLSRQYLEHQDELAVFRGSLRVKHQFTHLVARPDRLACRFDELSENTPINRVLRAAITRLRSLSRTAANLRRLDELRDRFREAADSPDPLRERVQLDRTNAVFHQLYHLARLFLSGDWQSTTSGQASGFALLFPMNELFETYIGRKAQQALQPLPVRLQDRRYFALRGPEGGAFGLRPDIIIEASEFPVVVDTKWKQLDADKTTNFAVSQSDVYQMLAYAHAYGSKRLVLLYPWHATLPPAGKLASWAVSGAAAILEIATVDIRSPASILDQLDQIFSSSYLI